MSDTWNSLAGHAERSLPRAGIVRTELAVEPGYSERPNWGKLKPVSDLSRTLHRTLRLFLSGMVSDAAGRGLHASAAGTVAETLP